MKMVVSGALGHIGSRLVRRLPEIFAGAEVVMLDNLLTQRFVSLFNLPSTGRYQFVEADVLEAGLEPWLASADAAIHLAAITDAAASFDNRKAVERVNYRATERMARACARVGCPLIHVSSTSVYGTQAAVVVEACGADELQPQSPYAETKLREERLLASLGETEDLKFVICRFGTISGVSPGMRFHTAVNKFCWQAVMGQPLSVWRTALHQKRPYLVLDDAVRAVGHIIRHNLFDGGIYNVLTDNLTVDDIIANIRLRVPALKIDFVDARIMNQLSYEVSNRKFRQQGFQYQGTLADSIRDTLQWLAGAGGQRAGGR